jgi:hypothetical protein
MIYRLSQIYDRAAAAASSLPADEQALWRDLIRVSAVYAGLRLDWRWAAPGDRAEIDQKRTRAHDVVIDACNAISRRCGAHHLDQTWRAELGDTSVMENRKLIGDFACFVALVAAIEAR